MRVVCLWRGPGVCVCERACARRHCHPRLPPRNAARRGPGCWAEDLRGWRSLRPSVRPALWPDLFTGLSAADPPAPPPSASTATSALPDTRHGAGAALGSGATAAAAPCEVAAPRTAKPRAPAERAPRPRPASATSLPTVSQFTPPPPPPAHSTAGGKVAPGAAPRSRTTSSPTPLPPCTPFRLRPVFCA